MKERERAIRREAGRFELERMVDSRGWSFHENPASYSSAFNRGNMVLFLKRSC